MMAAFAANEAFQKTEVSRRHIRKKIVTLKDPLQWPSSRRTWPKANEPIQSPKALK
jgi:hypothetical protein